MNLRYQVLFIAMVLLFAGAAFSQIPGMIPWWDGPIVRDLGLSEEQSRQIRATVRESRSRLIQLRAAMETAEADLHDEMNEEKVDRQKAEAAIEKVVAARSDLTRAVSQMSLKLRMILTNEQWQELQKRQQRMGPNQPGPNPPRPQGTGEPPRPPRPPGADEAGAFEPEAPRPPIPPDS